MSVNTPGVTVMMTAAMHATATVARAHATTANGMTAAHGGTATIVVIVVAAQLGVGVI